MCYMLIGGRNAFESGVMLGGHNDDLFGYDAALMEIYPHAHHEPGCVDPAADRSCDPTAERNGSAFDAQNISRQFGRRYHCHQ